MVENVKITVEQFDNGYTYRWSDINGEHDPSNMVSLGRDFPEILGQEILDDIKTIMDEKPCNIVELNIVYKGVQEQPTLEKQN